MDVLRQILTEGEEVRVGSFGRCTVVNDLSGGDKTVISCSAKSLKQVLNVGEGIFLMTMWYRARLSRVKKIFIF